MFRAEISWNTNVYASMLYIFPSNLTLIIPKLFWNILEILRSFFFFFFAQEYVGISTILPCLIVPLCRLFNCITRWYSIYARSSAVLSVNQSSQLPWKVFLSRGKVKKLPREGGVDSPEWRKFFKDVIKLWNGLKKKKKKRETGTGRGAGVSPVGNFYEANYHFPWARHTVVAIDDWPIWVDV